MKLEHVFFYSVSLVVILSLVSCQSEIELTALTPTVAVTSTDVFESMLESQMPLSPTPTETAIVMVKTTPVSDSTALSTIVSETQTPSSALATQTIVVDTLTPLPTFEIEKLEVAVEELLANPMNCDVPCWWGAIPNKTTVFEVQQFLTLHEFTNYQHDENQIPDYIELWFDYEENEERIYFPVRYSFENHLLKIVYAGQAPRLSNILRKYGKPDEIWIETKSYKREGNLSVRLNLVYLQKGMAVGYVVDGDIQGDIVTGCFADKETGILHLLVPDVVTSYKDFVSIFSLERHYLLLEEATSLTMDDFMQQFSDPSKPQCIETPTELWE
jgi:hypothetical protein